MSALLAIRSSAFYLWHPATMLAGEFWTLGDGLTGLQILLNQKDSIREARRPREVGGWSCR